MSKKSFCCSTTQAAIYSWNTPPPHRHHFTILRCIIPPLLLFCNTYNCVASASCVCEWVVYDFWQDALRIEIWSGSAHVQWVPGVLHYAAIIQGARLLETNLRSQLYWFYIVNLVASWLFESFYLTASGRETSCFTEQYVCVFICLQACILVALMNICAMTHGYMCCDSRICVQ